MESNDSSGKKKIPYDPVKKTEAVAAVVCKGNGFIR